MSVNLKGFLILLLSGQTHDCSKVTVIKIVSTYLLVNIKPSIQMLFESVQLYFHVFLILVRIHFMILISKLFSNWNQSDSKSTDNKSKFRGQTVVITGGNNGIGAELATELALLGAKVIIACRDVQKGRRLRHQAVKKSNGLVDICVLHLDLASLTSVRSFAQLLLQQVSVVDILINNAGVVMPNYDETKDGFEKTFQVNYLSHFLLTHLLLNALHMSTSPKVVNVTSSFHALASINFSDMNQRQNYHYLRAYGQSKLAQIMFGKSLTRQFPRMKTYNVDPGPVRTSIDREFTHWPDIIRVPFELYKMTLLKTAKQGAATVLLCLTDKRLDQEMSGLYYSNDKPAKPIKEAESIQDQEQLWLYSMKMLQIDELMNRIF